MAYKLPRGGLCVKGVTLRIRNIRVVENILNFTQKYPKRKIDLSKREP